MADRTSVEGSHEMSGDTRSTVQVFIILTHGWFSQNIKTNTTMQNAADSFYKSFILITELTVKTTYCVSHFNSNVTDNTIVYSVLRSSLSLLVIRSHMSHSILKSCFVKEITIWTKLNFLSLSLFNSMQSVRPEKIGIRTYDSMLNKIAWRTPKF